MCKESGFWFVISIEISFWIWDFNSKWVLICPSYWNPAFNKFICITTENPTIPWKNIYEVSVLWIIRLISDYFLVSLFTSFKWSTFKMQKYTEAEYDNIQPYTKTCHFEALYKMVHITKWMQIGLKWTNTNLLFDTG